MSETKTTTLRLPALLMAEAEAYARSVGLSANGLMGVALRDYLDARSRTQPSVQPSPVPAPAPVASRPVEVPSASPRGTPAPSPSAVKPSPAPAARPGFLYVPGAGYVPVSRPGERRKKKGK